MVSGPVVTMRSKALGLALVIFLAAALPAAAANYRFSVPREVVVVTVNQDSSLDIDYKILFENAASADPIDIVDIGFPTNDYDLGSVGADIDGVPCSGIKPSTYIKTGVEIPLGAHAIPPGKTGLLHVTGRNPGMVWADEADDAYASCVFSPNWFGSDFTTGSTHLTMVVVFPPGVTGDKSRWHDAEGGQPSYAVVRKGRVHYIWDLTGASPSTQYKFGVSFPRDTVSEVKKVNPFTVILGAIAWLFSALAKYCACIVPIAIFVGLGVLGSVNSRRRRMKYLSPKAKVEGVGIKRGLTAPEAALLLEIPLNKVLTLIMFGLLKKKALTITSQKPLKLKPPEKAEGLRPYEVDFLTAIETDGDLDERKLRKMIVDMIKEVETKMKGFSHKETVAYYRSIVSTAWKLVEQAETPELKGEEYTNSLEWTMLDEKFDDRTRDIFATTYVPMPYWWAFFPAGSVPAGTAATPGAMPTIPGTSFATTVVGQMESFAHNVVTKVESFTGAITSVTNPPPVSTSSGGGSFGGGGSGCACACACAGCACACAGGGR